VSEGTGWNTCPKAPQVIEASSIEISLYGESAPSSGLKSARDIIYVGKIQASF
jgi:hypothetical protein